MMMMRLTVEFRHYLFIGFNIFYYDYPIDSFEIDLKGLLLHNVYTDIL